MLQQHRQSYNFLFQLCTLERSLLPFLSVFLHLSRNFLTRKAAATMAMKEVSAKESQKAVEKRLRQTHTHVNRNTIVKICCMQNTDFKIGMYLRRRKKAPNHRTKKKAQRVAVNIYHLLLLKK